jgi:hypothetical protein
MTVAVETDCENKAQNGAASLVTASGGGAADNLCHVDCANRGELLCVVSRSLAGS